MRSAISGCVLISSNGGICPSGQVNVSQGLDGRLPVAGNHLIFTRCFSGWGPSFLILAFWDSDELEVDADSVLTEPCKCQQRACHGRHVTIPIDCEMPPGTPLLFRSSSVKAGMQSDHP